MKQITLEAPTGQQTIIVQANETIEISLQDLQPGSREFHLTVHFLGDNSTCNVTGRAQAKNADTKYWSVKQLYSGAHQIGNINLRGVGQNTAQLRFDAAAVLEKTSNMASAHIDEKIILFDNAKAKALPVLRVETDAVESASHAASVAPIEAELLLYAAARGIAPTDARAMITNGFLQL